MKKLLFLFIFILSYGANVTYLGIVLDSNKIENNKAKYVQLIRKIINRYEKQFLMKNTSEPFTGVLEVYDIRNGKVVFNTIKRSGHSLKINKLFGLFNKLGGKKSSNKANLAQVIENIKLNTIFPFYHKVEIYFLESLLTDNKTIDFNQNKGFPNQNCLNQKLPFVYNKPMRDNIKYNVYVWNKENRFAKQYIYYFKNLFKDLNLNLVEYREDNNLLGSAPVDISPIHLQQINLSMSNKCKLEDGTTPITSFVNDKVTTSEPETGVVMLNGSNPNRANSQIELRFNSKIYYVTADDKGNYHKEFNLDPTKQNILEVKMMNNNYKHVYSSEYVENKYDTIKCKIKGNNIIIEGTNKYRKVDSQVKIIYNYDETATTPVNRKHKYKILLPLKAKLNHISIIQLNGAKQDCPLLRANIKALDNITYSVKNMTATIYLSNPDRKKGDSVYYKYTNNDKNKIVKKTLEEDTNNHLLYFRVPLTYQREHHFFIKQLNGSWKSKTILLASLPTNFVRIRINFSCNSDVDLHVLEPKKNPLNTKHNAEVFYNSRRNYGDLDIDSHSKSQGPENYVLDLQNAPQGRYYYWVEWYSRFKNFSKYHNKTCNVRLEIVKNGEVVVKNLPFMSVPNTSNSIQKLKYSTYPSLNSENRNSIKQNAFYFDIN